MQHITRNLIAVAALALLAGCASTGDTTGQDQTGAQQDATTEQGITAQPGQDAYSYPYGQAPSQYDTYDTTGGTAGGQAGGGRPGQAVAGGGSAVSADRIVYFSFDSAEILPESQAIISKNARVLTGNTRIITQLEGHTDERGSREYNIALGERRANAVRQAMIAMGVSPQQIRVVSYGEERPATAGQSEQSYALNRRVEIVY
ncbi:MAG: peptidoglycan-associated lipoprotein Pal [Candidatus Contendobacter sp.]|nr:peptidoglycan-associated lipoprotein Pal [Candidatus Contendobacter sp.]MDS4059314.1 peptidoglycan-associated lipoprotein Pal [Candidatus Contendobacter sp.]